MTIRRLHHAQITIPIGTEETARTFYCGVLGLREMAKAEALLQRGGLWLAVGDLQLHIGVEDGVNRAATKAHLAYEVDDLRAWRAKLTAAGVRITESISISGYDRLEFRDPFGNRVEMMQRTR